MKPLKGVMPITQVALVRVRVSWVYIVSSAIIASHPCGAWVKPIILLFLLLYLRSHCGRGLKLQVGSSVSRFCVAPRAGGWF